MLRPEEFGILCGSLVFEVVAIFARDEPLYANFLRGIDDGDLVRDANETYSGHDGVLALEGVKEGRRGIIGLDDFYAGGECGSRCWATERTNVEVPVSEEAFDEGCTELSASLKTMALC